MPSSFPKLNDEDWLHEKYHVESMSDSEIADIVGCKRRTVADARDRLGIDSEYFADGRVRDEEWMLKQKDVEASELASNLDCDRQTVVKWRKRFGIHSSACPDCSEQYMRVTDHIRSSNCEPPDMPKRTREMVKALVISDGGIQVRESRKGPLFKASSVQRDFAEYICERLGWLCMGIYERKKTKENHGRVYSVKSYEWPVFRKWKDWGKTLENVENVSSEFMRVWFAADGGLSWVPNSDEAYIELYSQGEDIDDIKRVFGQVGIEPTYRNGHIRVVDLQDRKRFFELCGGPLPGYEYKWCWKNERKYKKMIQEAKPWRE